MNLDRQRLRAAIPDVKQRPANGRWCQRSLFAGDQCCVVGAFWRALGMDRMDLLTNLESHTYKVLVDDLDELFSLSSAYQKPPRLAETIIGWNDAPHRLVKDVFELLDEFDKLLDIQIALETEK